MDLFRYCKTLMEFDETLFNFSGLEFKIDDSWFDKYFQFWNSIFFEYIKIFNPFQYS